jgi:exopolyphosphatase/guanosine-5'-triphosphate,3'-diphosphate pyrophosphatase
MTVNTHVAAIDVGSNAIRMVLVEIAPTGQEVHRAMHRYALRLGEDVFSTGVISTTTLEALTHIFKTIASLLQSHRVKHYRAVATSAMREARNQEHVVHTLASHTGVVLEVISGEEESRLARKALVRSLGYAPPSTLLIDLGGGSLEIERAGRRPGVSLPLGVVRLLHAHPGVAGKCSKKRYNILVNHVLQSLEETQKLTPSAPLAVGTGGNLSLLSEQLPHTGFNHPAIHVQQLEPFAHTVRALSVQQRIQRFHIRKDRADVLLPALAVIQAIVEFYEVKTFVTPPAGLRDTLLLQLVPPPRIWKMAKETLPHTKGLDILTTLFTSLAPIHGLWPQALGACAAEYALLINPHAEELRTTYLALQTPAPIRTLAQAMAQWAHAAYQSTPSGKLRVELLTDPFRLTLHTQKPIPLGVTNALSKALGRTLQIR